MMLGRTSGIAVFNRFDREGPKVASRGPADPAEGPRGPEGGEGPAGQPAGMTTPYSWILR
jgi:hypothetical protein